MANSVGDRLSKGGHQPVLFILRAAGPVAEINQRTLGNLDVLESACQNEVRA